MAEIYKQIKDFTLKNSIDGTEDILIQSNGITMRVKSSQLKTNIDLSNYYTKSEVDNLFANIDVNIDMADYYDKTTIDNLLLNKANVSHTHTSADITDLSIPTVDVNKAYVDSQLANKSNTNHTHDEYISETELNEKGYATETYVTNKIAEASLNGGEVDLSNYTTKTELTTELNKKANLFHTHNAEDINGLNIPTKLSELQNDSGFISEIPSEYINETELNNALANKANTSDIPSLAGYATKDDLNTKADKSEIPSLEGYATETFVTNKIAEASLSGGEVDLSGLATKDELNSSLATKSDTTHNHDTVYAPIEHEHSQYLTSVPSEYVTDEELNAKGYLTSHQDISGKADKLYVDTELAKKSDKTHTHSYNNLTDKPTIPSIDNLATKEELTDGLATKADKTAIPTKTSQLTNDRGYLTSIPEEYITETELENKGYLTSHQDISGLQTKTDFEKIGHKKTNYSLEWIPNEYIESDGTVVSYDGWERTDFVTISKGEQILIAESTCSIDYYCCFYDANDSKVSAFAIPSGDSIVNIPNGAVKFRVSKPENETLIIRNQLFDNFYSKCAVLNVRDKKIEITNSEDGLSFQIKIPKDTGISVYHHSLGKYFLEDCVINYVKSEDFRHALSFNVLIDIDTMTLKVVPYYGNGRTYTLAPSEYMLFTLYIERNIVITSLPDSYYKNVVVTSDLTPIKNDIELLKKQAPVGHLISQSKRPYNNWSTFKFSNPVLNLAICTDVHADKENLSRFIIFTNEYSALLDEKICLGDMVGSKFSDDFNYWGEVEGSENILCVIGNHDTWRNDSNEPITDKTQVYNKFLANNINRWGVVQPPNAEINGYNYYYKDYPESLIRIIFLDDNYYDDNQHNWFVETLNNAREQGYHVLACEHQQPTKELVSINSNFESLDYDYTKLVVNKRYQDRVDAIDTFISQGGTFVSWLSGDSHYDNFGLYKGTSGNQLSLVFENTSCDDFWGDSNRVRGEKSQDSFNIVSIDTYSKLIKVVRVGNTTDRFLRNKNHLCYNYGTHNLISQS